MTEQRKRHLEEKYSSTRTQKKEFTIGGAGGGLLLAVIDTRLLRLIFSALVVWSGITMIF